MSEPKKQSGLEAFKAGLMQETEEERAERLYRDSFPIRELREMGTALVQWVLTCLAFGVLYLGYVNIIDGGECLDVDTVKTVGGCNALGTCGVKYASGNTGRIGHPVAGELICTRKSWVKPSHHSILRKGGKY
jgi:hypothetical protein